MKLSDIQKEMYKESTKAGYTELWNKPTEAMKILEEECGIVPIDLIQEQKIYDIAEIGLISTEVSELIEEIRNKEVNWDKVAFEGADIIIRALNFLSRKNIDATKAIMDKHEKNMKRETLHGRGV